MSVPVCLFLLVAIASGAAATGQGQARRPAPPDLSAAVAGIQKGLTQLRGHGFTAEVVLELLSEAEVKTFLEKKLAEEYPDERLAAEQKAYQHFGLLKQGEDLKTLFLEMLTGQAAGFYDPDEKRLFLVEGKPLPGIALVHELAHALQDQRFDVGPLLERARDNDDRLRAVHSMIEGEAMALSASYLLTRPEEAGLLEALGGRADAKEQLALSVEQLQRFPESLQGDLMFPYLEGMMWASAVQRSGGGALMDQIFKDPPDSSEQILHPDKINQPRDTPSTIGREVLPDLSTDSYRTIKVNVWGEFGIRQVLGGWKGADQAEAADGWDGDLYAVYEKDGAGMGAIWVSAWDSADDAAEFQERASAWLRGRDRSGSRHRILLGGPQRRVVGIVDGFADPLAGRLEEDLRAALGSGVQLR